MARPGLALILVVGTLGILSVLGSAFVVLGRLERKAAQQRIWGTQAGLLARSGVEDALARLARGQDPGLFQNAYGGENWDASPDLLLSAYEAAQEVHHPTGPTTGADVEGCPVRHAMRPTWFKRGTGGNPSTLPVEARERGYTGRLSAGVWSLQVEDESAKFNVNGGILDLQDRDNDAVPDHQDTWVTDLRPPVPFQATSNAIGRGWNGQAVRVLDILGSQLGVPGLGTLAVQGRPAGGYRTLDEVQAAVGATSDLSPWLTVSSWVDPGVVHPNGHRGQFLAAALSPVCPSAVKKGRLPLALEEGGRPPVNLNAASRPVLVSLLQSLEGACWQSLDKSFAMAVPRKLSPAQAGAVADALLARRRTDPFDGWPEFYGFCDGLVPAVLNGVPSGYAGGGNLELADLLKANFDPNTRSNKELPDQHLFRWLDKTDLITYSTEGCLFPTGRFRVAAAGRLLSTQGKLLAQRERTSDLEAYGMLRHTSQRDFVAGRARFEDYLGLAALPERTPGVSAPAWKTWGGPEGLAILTYPEPPAAVAAGRASALDGGLSLATLEIPPTPPAGTVPTDGIRFLHHFDDGWDGDLTAAGGDPVRKPGPGSCDLFLQACTDLTVWPAATGAEPNTLYADGMHAQTGRCPAYETLPNFPPDLPAAPPSHHAAIAFWIKPHKRNAAFFTDYDLAFTCIRGSGSSTQTLLFGFGLASDEWGCQFENAVSSVDPGIEDYVGLLQAEPASMRRLPCQRWQLFSACLDSDDVTTPLTMSIRGVASENIGASMIPYYVPINAAGAEDLFASGVLFVLGGQNTPNSLNADLYPVNAVIDELALLDFGDLSGTARADADTWASGLYKDGRYYKGDDADYVSPALDPLQGRPVRLLNARWTAWLPSRDPLEHRTSGTLAASGVPRFHDARLDGSSLGLSLLRPDGTSSPAVQGAPLLEPPSSALRYLARPRTGLAGDLDSPALESPYLDDVTFAWQGVGGPRFLAWGR